MEFRLTYEGKLLAHRDDKRLAERSLHVHDIRKEFHKQLKELWRCHPVLSAIMENAQKPGLTQLHYVKRDGFDWLPLATVSSGLICKLDVLILRKGESNVVYDVDNRLKTLLDALRMANNTQELGDQTKEGKQSPNDGETPFYVLLEDDRLVTHIAITTDMLLQPVPNTPSDEAVRLVIDVTIRPYRTSMDNLDFS